MRGLSWDKKRSRWFIQFTMLNGRKYRERLKPETTEREAQRYLARLFQLDQVGELLTPKERRKKERERKEEVRHTVHSLCETYIPYKQAHVAPSTLETMIYHFGKLDDLFGDMFVDEITTQHIVEYQIKRQRDTNQKGEPISNVTINNEVGTLVGLLKFAVTLNLIPAVPHVRKLPRNSPKKRALTEEQVERALANAYERGYAWYALTWVFAFCGLRRQEAVNMKWENVHLDRKLIHIPQEDSKTIERNVALSQKTVEVLEQLPRVHERVFVRLYRGSYVPLPLDLRIRNHGCDRENVYPWEGEDDDLHVGPHTFRHTLATRMAQYNIHVSKTQKLLGHSTTETTRSIYTHVEESQIHEDMERIPAPATMPRLRVVGEDE